MTDRLDALVRAPLRSLPLAILLGTAASGIVIPFLQWLGLLVFRYTPSPPGSVWVDFMLTRAATGAFVGAAAYMAGRLSAGWLRTCLHWTLLVLLIEGEIDDFVGNSLGEFLIVCAGASLLPGVIVGTVFHVRERRARQAAAP